MIPILAHLLTEAPVAPVASDSVSFIPSQMPDELA